MKKKCRLVCGLRVTLPSGRLQRLLMHLVNDEFGPHAIGRMATFNGIYECSKFTRIKLSYRRRQCFLLYSELWPPVFYIVLIICVFVYLLIKVLKDVRAHCYCASLVRTLFIGHAIFRRAHRFENSTKHRADDLCVNLVCEYFCWMLGDPHFFFGRSLPFLSLSIILKNKKNLCGKF